MKRYKKNKSPKFFKFMVVVPSQKDKDELIEAFRYIHYLRELDTDYIIVNQLAHLYLDEPENPVQIMIDKEMFDKLSDTRTSK